MKKVIDCFIFYNELDMLEFRLKELNDHVDKFVLVEATHTFTGNPKRLHFEKSKERYKDYLHKIEHVIVDDCPNTSNPWDNEYHQRKCIKNGIKKLSLDDNDIIIISDIDEIPNKEILLQMKKNEDKTQFTILEMDIYYFNLTTKGKKKWYEGSRLLSYEMFKNEFKSDSQRVRFTFSDIFTINHPEMKTRPGVRVVKNGGWHLSYFGDERFIQNKIMNFSHQENNTSELTNLKHIKKCIEYKIDVFGRGGLLNIPFDENTFLPENYDILLNN